MRLCRTRIAPAPLTQNNTSDLTSRKGNAVAKNVGKKQEGLRPQKVQISVRLCLITRNKVVYLLMIKTFEHI